MRFGTIKARLNDRLSRFRRCEDGSYSLEAIIWMPIFAILLCVIMNVTMVFCSESQMLRVTQDANRLLSLRRFEDTDEVVAYIRDRLDYLDLGNDLQISSVVNTSGVITTSLSTSASNLMPFNFMRATFASVGVGVTAQHIIEY